MIRDEENEIDNITQSDHDTASEIDFEDIVELNQRQVNSLFFYFDNSDIRQLFYVTTNVQSPKG